MRNHDGNNPPRVEITLEGSSSVTLTRTYVGNGRVKVFTLPILGTEITFNGTDNKFTAAQLPLTLYVEGQTGSSAARDVELELTCDANAGVKDIVAFTVIWVELSARHSGTVSNDNAAKTFYNSLLIPPEADPNNAPLGYCRTNVVGTVTSAAAYGIASEFVGTTQPFNLVPDLYGFLGGSLTLEREIVARKGWFQEPGDVVTQIPDAAEFPLPDPSSDSLTDFDPQSGGSLGKIYDIDIPGFALKAPAFLETGLNFRIRYRQNFRYWAEYGSIRCSLRAEWYTRLALIGSGEREAHAATGSAINKIVDNQRNWPNNKWKDGVAVAVRGGEGGFVQWRRVSASDATSITVSPNFDPMPDLPFFYTVIAATALPADPAAPAGDNQNGNGTTNLTWDLS